MKLFSLPDSVVNRKERAQWLTPPFDVAWSDRLALFWLPSGTINRRDRAQWLTPPLTLAFAALVPASVRRLAGFARADVRAWTPARADTRFNGRGSLPS